MLSYPSCIFSYNCGQSREQSLKPYNLLISTLVNTKETCIWTVFQVGAPEQFYSLYVVLSKQLVFAQPTLPPSFPHVNFAQFIFVMFVCSCMISLVFGLSHWKIEKGYFLWWVKQKKLTFYQQLTTFIHIMWKVHLNVDICQKYKVYILSIYFFYFLLSSWILWGLAPPFLINFVPSSQETDGKMKEIYCQV